MSDKIISWDSVMDATMKFPGITVDRKEYLTEAFSRYGDINDIGNKRPIDLFSKEVIEKVARDAINGQTMKVTAISSAMGLPGGLAMIGTIPGDLAQFYFHVIVLAQKLGYIYGWPDLLDEGGKWSEGSKNIMTIFIGVMMGAQAAEKVIGEIAKRVAEQVAKRLPQKALTKTIWYPIIKQVAKWLGIQITKQSVGKTAAKVVPILGGFISGGITLATFRPMANRLRNELRNEMDLFRTTDTHFFFDQDEDEQVIMTEEELEEIRILACINIAKIDFDFDENEQVFLINMIESSTLSDDSKAELLGKLHEKELTDIDFSNIKTNEIFAISLLESLVSVVNLDGAANPAEKIYLRKIANDLDVSREQLEEIILASRGV